MKYIKSFIQDNSYVKFIKYKKFGGTNWGYVFIKLYNSKKINIEPKGECPSISYLVEFKDYPFSKIINKKMISLVEITSKHIVRKYFRNIEPINFTYILNERYTTQNTDNIFNKYHLYRIKLSNNYSFYFGLINSSDGTKDGDLKISEVSLNLFNRIK